MKVVILTGRRASLEDFARGLGMGVEWAGSAGDVLSRAGTGGFRLVVVDAVMQGLDYKSFLADLLRVNAMLDTVVVTGMDEGMFHEDSEGLGVLCPVPAEPGRVHGEMAAARLRQVSGMS